MSQFLKYVTDIESLESGWQAVSHNSQKLITSPLLLSGAWMTVRTSQLQKISWDLFLLIFCWSLEGRSFASVPKKSRVLMFWMTGMQKWISACIGSGSWNNMQKNFSVQTHVFHFLCNRYGTFYFICTFILFYYFFSLIS